MPEVWYKDESCENYREDCHFDPPKFVTLEKLKESTGVECYQVDVDSLENADEYWQLRKDRGYDYEDTVEISEQTMGKEFYAKLKTFYTEHLHDDDEIRLFLKGSGYFDVRDNKDNWIRIHSFKNDLLIVPAGIYHRFTLDKKSYCKVNRLFSGTPVWVAKFRPEADSELSRQQYLNKLNSK